MSLMQLPAPNTSAKVIVSFRYIRYCYLSYAFSQIQAGGPAGVVGVYIYSFIIHHDC